MSLTQDIEFVIETEPGKRAAPPPYVHSITYANTSSAQPFAARIIPQSRVTATPEKAAPPTHQLKAGSPSLPTSH
jgi:hypothetical protein